MCYDRPIIAFLFAFCATNAPSAQILASAQVAAAASAPVTAIEEQRPWLAFGELRGYLEPCGCHPDSDLGGLRRLGSFIHQARRQHPNLRLYDLGNNLPVDFAAEQIKVPFLLEGLAALKPTASLFNWLEISHHDEVSQETPARQLPYLLSNAKRPFAQVAASLQDQLELVIGIVEPQSDEQRQYLQPITSAFAPQLQQLLRTRQKGQELVLLYAGSLTGLEQLLAWQDFDRIILANDAPLHEHINHRERHAPYLLMKRLHDAVHMMVPVGGQGVLRGGSLQQRHPLTLSEILNPAATSCDIAGTSCREASSTGLLAPQHLELVTWLDRSFELIHPFQELFSRYEARVAAAFAAGVSARLAELAASPYAGSQACQGCHSTAYEVWQRSAHAKAWSTLVAAGKDQDAYCVGCHVVGLTDVGGFVSFEHSPHLANVQCESCHGPRKLHAENPFAPHTAAPQAGNDLCQSCHHGTHSPEFVFDLYWQKIAHGF